MYIGDTQIEDTFAEAFGMRYTRLIVTADDEYWLEAALREFTGHSTSVIACDAEIGLERRIVTDESPDGRPGAAVLVFGMKGESLEKVVPNRVGQCWMTCPTTAVFNGLDGAVEKIPLGKFLRYFGDGYQKSKQIGGRRYWRIPVMDGEFLVEESAGVAKGVAGGNLILQARDKPAGLAAARRAVASIAEMSGVITPFPGGVARSGSKVGSRYQGLVASTAEAYCPTLRGRVPSRLIISANCAYEIVVDGVDEASVGRALATAIRAAVGEGIVTITAGNYGGKLGKYHFHLRQLLADG